MNRYGLLPVCVLALIAGRAAAAATPLMNDPTRPATWQAEGQPGRALSAPHVLSGIFGSQSGIRAMVDGRLVGTGDVINGDRVIFIGEGVVHLEGSSGKITLFLPGSTVRSGTGNTPESTTGGSG